MASVAGWPKFSPPQPDQSWVHDLPMSGVSISECHCLMSKLLSQFLELHLPGKTCEVSGSGLLFTHPQTLKRNTAVFQKTPQFTPSPRSQHS